MNMRVENSTKDMDPQGSQPVQKKPASKYTSPSMKMHRKQSFWQIAFPLIVGCFIVVGLFIWLVLASSTNYDISLYWANISFIILIVLFSLLGLLELVLIIGGIYGVAKLIYYTPIYTQIAQTYIYRAAALIIEYADHSVKPVYFIQSGLTGFMTFINRLTHIRSVGKENTQ
jgi:hypothetical protein